MKSTKIDLILKDSKSSKDRLIVSTEKVVFSFQNLKYFFRICEYKSKKLSSIITIKKQNINLHTVFDNGSDGLTLKIIHDKWVEEFDLKPEDAIKIYQFIDDKLEEYCDNQNLSVKTSQKKKKQPSMKASKPNKMKSVQKPEEVVVKPGNLYPYLGDDLAIENSYRTEENNPFTTVNNPFIRTGPSYTPYQGHVADEYILRDNQSALQERRKKQLEWRAEQESIVASDFPPVPPHPLIDLSDCPPVPYHVEPVYTQTRDWLAN